MLPNMLTWHNEEQHGTFPVVAMALFGGGDRMSMARAKSPTIIDVAREAGVSKSAVSRALLGQGDVSAETLERVRAAADRLGYVPNAMARGLVSQRTKTLGLVLRDTTIQFYGYLQAAIQRRAAQLGYEVISVTGVDELTPEDAREALRSLISLRVDGLIVSSAQLPGEDLVRYVDRVPIVVAGRAEYSQGVVSVHCDEEYGGRGSRSTSRGWDTAMWRCFW